MALFGYENDGECLNFSVTAKRLRLTYYVNFDIPIPLAGNYSPNDASIFGSIELRVAIEM